MYVVDTDKRITGFGTGQFTISDTVTLERAVEKSMVRYKKAIESGFTISQDGVGKIDHDKDGNADFIHMEKSMDRQE
jgi:hypothetical protein